MNFLSKNFIKFSSFFLMMLIFCCTQKPAKIVNRSKVLYNKNNQFNLQKYQNLTKESSLKNNQKTPSSEPDLSNSNHKNQDLVNKKSVDALDVKDEKLKTQEDYKVLITDNKETLYSLAQKYQISVREIIDANNLKAPYRLKKGDSLKIPKQQFHQVKVGDTLFSISRKYNMKVEEIIALNNLEKPYKIKPKSRLQIANFNKNNFVSNELDSKKNLSTNRNVIASQDLSAPSQENNLNSREPEKEPEVASQNSLNHSSSSVQSKLGVSVDPNYQAKNTLSENNESQQKITKTDENQQQITKNNENKVITSDEENKIVSKKNNFLWPVRGSIVSRFGPKKGGLYNDGINIKAKEGSTVGSAEDGIVAYAGSELKGYGNLVIIKHSQGWITAYAHLKEFSVSRGQKILKSQKIGIVGNSGSVSFPQLYFGLRKGREAVDPLNYLKGSN